MSDTRVAIALADGTAADVGAVDRVMQAAFDPRFGEAWTPAQCLGMLSLPGVWLTLAHLDDRLVGFALTRAVADDAELLLIAMLPDQRGRGVDAPCCGGRSTMPLRAVPCGCASKCARATMPPASMPAKASPNAGSGAIIMPVAVANASTHTPMSGRFRANNKRCYLYCCDDRAVGR